MSKNKKEKYIRSGGVYWVDYAGFKLPEWGNTNNNTPHLAIMVNAGHFANKETYISIPLTTNSRYLEHYGERIVFKMLLEGRVHYALINHIRIVGKHRILKQFRLVTGDDIFVKSNDLLIINTKINDFYNSKLSLAARDLTLKEKKDE